MNFFFLVKEFLRERMFGNMWGGGYTIYDDIAFYKNWVKYEF